MHDGAEGLLARSASPSALHLVAPGPGDVPAATPAVSPEHVSPRPRPTAPATYALAAPALGEIAPLASVHLSAPGGRQRSGAPAGAHIAVSPDSRFRPEHRDLSAGAKLSLGESVTEADAVPDLLREGAGGGGIAGGAFASTPKGHAGTAVYAEQIDGGDPAYVVAPRAVVESLAERGSHPLKALDPRPQRNRLGSLLPAAERPEVDVVGLRASLDPFRRRRRCRDQGHCDESEADFGAPPHAAKVGATAESCQSPDRGRRALVTVWGDRGPHPDQESGPCLDHAPVDARRAAAAGQGVHPGPTARPAIEAQRVRDRPLRDGRACPDGSCRP